MNKEIETGDISIHRYHLLRLARVGKKSRTVTTSIERNTFG
jgi:hypothetical protein